MANITCPKCGGTNIDISLQQENHGSTTITKSKSKTKSGHGCLWWLFIGWWWVLIDACIWCFCSRSACASSCSNARNP